VHIKQRMTERGIGLELDNKAKEFIIQSGTNLDFGARPLRRALESLVEDPLSEEILRGSFENKNHILVTVHEEEDEKGKKHPHLYFDGQKREPAPSQATASGT